MGGWEGVKRDVHKENKQKVEMLTGVPLFSRALPRTSSDFSVQCTNILSETWF